MNVTEIATQLVKVLAENYAKDGKTELPVSALMGQLKNVDLNSILSALKSLEGQGMVSLLGAGESMLVKLIPQALAGGEHAGLVQKGMDILGGLLKK